MDLAGLTITDLWHRYVSIGGDSNVGDLARRVSSGDCPSDHEHNLIAQAINETFLELGENHPVAYRYS